jgi:hypothetical protein
VAADDEHQIGYQALQRGVPVIAADGVEVGRVHRVLDNAREHIFDGLEIRTGDGRRFVDAPEVARITTRRVVLTIPAADVAALPERGGAVSALEGSAARAARRLRRRLSR